MTINDTLLTPGAIVVIAGFDDIPSHLFQIDEVYEDVVTGIALTGPLEGEYGEPDKSLIQRIWPNDTQEASQGSS
ncbi:hypothetical protein [Celeribacter neptunius]|uniref:Uncharacterized protein n=1 Tax=Celeribacter neptunius TaxID=588602 RepID=A0A1I3SA26_9RHOB|nr:hypothetical protein [Celeribacter neptunius]SFJ55664.1 hypothetical protein SAMN04487991_2393 [Celeribacter neptunius]